MRRLALAGALGLLLLTTSSVFAATASNVWRASLSSTSTTMIHGGATIAEVAGGRAASVAVRLYGVKPDSMLSVTVMAGSTSIVPSKPFRMAGTAVNRFWLRGADLKNLDAAIDAKATLTITVTVTPHAAPGGAPVTPTTLTGTFARVTR